MRVLHVSPSIARSYGGPTQSLIGYLQACRAAGLEVVVASVAASREDEERVRAAGHRLHTFPGAGSGAGAFSLQLHRYVAEQAHRFDVIHVHGLLNPISSLAIRAGLRASRAVAVRPFGTLSRYSATHRRRWLKQLYFAGWERPALRRVAALHFTTEQERAEAAWHRLDVDAYGHVVPPPYDSTTAVSEEGPEAGLVVLVARLHPVKHVELVLEAWPTVRRARPDARLVIAGDGPAPYMEELQRRAAQAGTGITFAGFVDTDARNALLRRAAAFVLTSYHENFGLAVLEALGVGVPVVVTEAVQLSSFVRENGLGVVVARTAEMVAEGLLQVLNAPPPTREKAPALVSSTFSHEAVGRSLSTMYDAATQRAA